MKYLAFARIAFLQETAYRGALFSQGLVLRDRAATSYLESAHRRWQLLGGRTSSMLWYLALTEWIILSAPLVHLEIERDVRSGDIAYHLSRPVSYLTMRIAEGFGAFLFRLIVLGVVGFTSRGSTRAACPSAPRSGCSCRFGVLDGRNGLRRFSREHGPLGLLAAGFHSPLLGVAEAGFISGGLIFPLSIYPEWLQNVSSYTPFYFLLWPRAGRCEGRRRPRAAIFFGLIFWGLVAWGLLRLLSSKGKASCR